MFVRGLDIVVVGLVLKEGFWILFFLGVYRWFNVILVEVILGMFSGYYFELEVFFLFFLVKGF